jgi:hypothetical protein
MLANLVGGEVIDIGLAGLDERHCPLVKLREVVGGVTEAIPLEAEPAHVRQDGIDVLLLLLAGIGVVEAQVGFAAELVGQTKVDADGLGVADVEVAVGLGGKARLDDGVAVLFGATSSAIWSRRKLEEMGASFIGAAGLSGFELVIIEIPFVRVEQCLERL